MFITFVLGINHPVIREYENKDETNSSELQEDNFQKLSGFMKGFGATQVEQY